MSRWLVCDSLYPGHPEQFFCSHLDSLTHYLKSAGEDARSCCLNMLGVAGDIKEGEEFGDIDFLFLLDRYDTAASSWRPDVKRIAQVAAICDPMPWQVRNPDGSPAYSLILSSIPWMVDEARARGCRAEFMPLAFDTRALVAGMNVKERDIPCLFVGSRGGNHLKREEVLRELGDLVTIAPPTFGRSYFELLARAKVVLQIHAEWARGAANAMKIFEAAGMGASVVFDGCWPDEAGEIFGFGQPEMDGGMVSDIVRSLLDGNLDSFKDVVLQEHTYIQRIPQLLDLTRSL